MIECKTSLRVQKRYKWYLKNKYLTIKIQNVILFKHVTHNVFYDILYVMQTIKQSIHSHPVANGLTGVHSLRQSYVYLAAVMNETVSG